MDPKLVRLPPFILVSTFTLLLLPFLSPPVASQLSSGFYSSSCPDVELLVKNTVRSAYEIDSTIPAKLLRLLFHDCIVQGCDGSVLVEGNGTERSDPANKSLGGFYVVESAKRLLEFWCPGTVSCADILVLAARDAVELTGGPSVVVPLGRRDGAVSSAASVRPNMVDTTFTVDQLAQRFSSKGLSMDDLVILSGAHTIGSAHCTAFSDRFNQLSDGTMVPADASLERNYAMQLARKCPAGASDSVTTSNDPVTPSLFDNQYYGNLLAKKGLLQSDSVLVADARTKSTVEALSRSQDAFFASWAKSFVKLSTIGVKTGNEGAIRFLCASATG
ncbi:peroxidase 18-like [Musa acuminata AAA Group]|uniref:Peroxidase n=1 Tax=Musa acuminata subsp. malaccensis TaxID=214687 RepID=A0A804IK23_MUSAM|nr:PREDICTED: peroxidase 18 isoform X1 [Musa acuminata subsp. malaccensis]CAG1840945.1 unnamed protein product [Musa acuminata subsp. malaccensis]